MMNPQVTFRETAIVKKQEYLYYFCSNKVLYMQCYRSESGILSQWHRKKYYPKIELFEGLGYLETSRLFSISTSKCC